MAKASGTRKIVLPGGQTLISRDSGEGEALEAGRLLNERHYGALQGLNKAATAKRYSHEQVHLWRRSYDVPPPALTKKDQRHPSHDLRYKSLPENDLPCAECLKDTVTPFLPYWKEALVPSLQARFYLICAHEQSCVF